MRILGTITAVAIIALGGPAAFPTPERPHTAPAAPSTALAEPVAPAAAGPVEAPPAAPLTDPGQPAGRQDNDSAASPTPARIEVPPAATTIPVATLTVQTQPAPSPPGPWVPALSGPQAGVANGNGGWICWNAQGYPVIQLGPGCAPGWGDRAPEYPTPLGGPVGIGAPIP